MSGEVNPVPEGFHTVTPYMTSKGAPEAIEFYEEAFGATEIFRWAELGGSPAHLFLYVEDVDELFKRASGVGATELMPVEDSEDGDRRGGVTDPLGARLVHRCARRGRRGHLPHGTLETIRGATNQ
jgi:PhnB protein